MSDYIEVKLPTGDVCKLSVEDKWIADNFSLQKRKNHVSAEKWIETEWGYAHLVVYVHRLVTGTQKRKNLQIDHINRDGLDNRRENLRFANKSQNAANVAAKSNSKTGMKGVVNRSKTNIPKYCSLISVNKKTINLGYFDNINHAAMIFDLASISIHKDFAFLNLPQYKDAYNNIVSLFQLSDKRILVMSGSLKIKTSFERYSIRFDRSKELTLQQLEHMIVSFNSVNELPHS